MNSQNASAAIAHWLEYETLCGRSNLLSEASLTTPLGEFLNSTQSLTVKAQWRYPGQQPAAKGRRREMDFALLRRGVGTIAHMIESKWITGRRDYHQEIFDDLLRLETANYSLEQGRWLIIAGEKAAMDELRATQINQGGGAARVDVFNGVLPFDGAHPQINVPVAESIAAKRILWGRAAQALGLDELPLTIMVKLAARGESGATNKNFECWIWQIQSVRNRATRPLELEA